MQLILRTPTKRTLPPCIETAISGKPEQLPEESPHMQLQARGISEMGIHRSMLLTVSDLKIFVLLA